MIKLVIVELTGKSIEERVDEFVRKNNAVSLDEYMLHESYIRVLDAVKTFRKINIVVTYDKLYLLSFKELFWNEEMQRYEIYLLRDNGLISIYDTTEKEIRKEHNLYKMYINDGFKGDLINDVFKGNLISYD